MLIARAGATNMFAPLLSIAITCVIGSSQVSAAFPSHASTEA
jgi:hypothetical protein